MKQRWLLAASILVLSGRQARADDFFALSPGPLTQAHSEWGESTDGCVKCHELGQGVTDFRCLDCHQHRPLRDAIKAGRGLHATFQDACRKCHTEHKGRDAFIIDWSRVGGREKFLHDKTGFTLNGQHAQVACTACHKRKLKSGRTSFVGVTSDCDGCHQNPHRFSRRELRQACTRCHLPGVTAKLTASELFFDHQERSGLALSGAHGKAACTQCHAGGDMSQKGPARTCASCHQKKSPHGPAFKRSACNDCHGEGGNWKSSSFDHERTGFPLVAKHDTQRCGKCHKSATKKPDPACQSCHGDPHRGRFDELSCASCHGKGGSKKPRFDHASRTGLALTGKHAGAGCRDCHRGKGPRAFERFETPDCMSCHQHQNAHRGEFRDKPCLGCHLEGGSRDLSFDHDRDTRFALTGLHQSLEDRGECQKCHPQGNFRTGKLACKDCHQDAHQGQLGDTCDRCHGTSVRFQELVFDHDRLSQFPLELKHESVACESCHPKRAYKTGKTACADCHAKDDPHGGKLGTACETCHVPAPGAPRFDHEKMTTFARTGAHLSAKCESCHRAAPASPPPVGWTRTAAPLPLDRHFPVMGKSCSGCHLDPHAGSRGGACESCHGTTDFSSTSRAVHDTGAFRLEGVHDLLPCQRCHEPGRGLAGLGALCIECHRADDTHNNALGPMCGRCHGQIDWLPARFNHASAGFSLRGAHQTARCSDCHTIGRFAGTPRECSTCHQVQALRVSEPVHNAELGECKRCHNEVAFTPARRDHPRFSLSGAHAAARCSDCHSGGRYTGTPRDCVGCHQADFDRTTRPNHARAAFTPRCESCHVAVTWSGARYQHKSFIARGLHRTASCDRCHPGDGFDGAFNGRIAAFDCAGCHTAGGPVSRRPADHDAKGYPQECALCHSELVWVPAKRPR